MRKEKGMVTGKLPFRRDLSMFTKSSALRTRNTDVLKSLMCSNYITSRIKVLDFHEDKIYVKKKVE